MTIGVVVTVGVITAAFALLAAVGSLG
jgi:hypothetical protein